jgi:beta-glucosidase
VLFLSPGSKLSAQKTSPSNPQLADSAIEKRVDDLLEQMTLDEKIGQLVQYNDAGRPAARTADQEIAANPEATAKVDAKQLAATGRMGSMLNVTGAARANGFQKLAVEQSRLHIPLLFGADIIHGYRTIYPVPLGIAATWDMELIEKLCAISASEAATAGVRWFYSPMVDIARDARWGRITEGAGEDPYLGAAVARAYIHGYQGKSLADRTSVAASVKHFAAYGAAEGGREYFTTDMSLSRLHDVYLPPYKAAVEAGAATMMSAFNSLNGVPATANPYLLDTLLRKQWGFDGFVVSDYTAVMELTHHGVALDAAEATRKALRAGVDVDMMSHYYDVELPRMVKTGVMPMAVVDEAVRRVLRVKFALGLFEHPYPTAPEVLTAVPEHRPFVRQAASESLVLLQNRNSVLPIAASVKNIALIGPLADDATDMQGAWGAGNRNTDVITLKQGLEARAEKTGASVTTVKGTEILGQSESGFAAAEDAARDADLVVLAMGESGMMSGEAGSRAHLDLPGNQQALLDRVAALHKPTVLVVFSGRPLVLTPAAKEVDAIVEAWFPGTEAGNAIAEVLFGDVSPSGKLTVSFPYTVGQEPLYYAQFPTGRPPFSANLNIPPTGNSRFVSRYIDAPNAALFPFGFGLSYTTFDYSNVHLSTATVKMYDAMAPGNAPLVTATATITNTGSRVGTDVAQLYIRKRGASLEQPMRELKGFSRVTLKPGESRTVLFPLSYEELSFHTNDGKPTIEPIEYTVYIGDDSTATKSSIFNISW